MIAESLGFFKTADETDLKHRILTEEFAREFRELGFLFMSVPSIDGTLSTSRHCCQFFFQEIAFYEPASSCSAFSNRTFFLRRNRSTKLEWSPNSKTRRRRSHECSIIFPTRSIFMREFSSSKETIKGCFSERKSLSRLVYRTSSCSRLWSKRESWSAQNIALDTILKIKELFKKKPLSFFRNLDSSIRVSVRTKKEKKKKTKKTKQKSSGFVKSSLHVLPNQVEDFGLVFFWGRILSCDPFEYLGVWDLQQALIVADLFLVES